MQKYTGVLIGPQLDQEGNKLQRQKILSFIYPIYNHNWRNISTIYDQTRLASNDIFLPSNKINQEVGQAKDLPAPVYVCQYVFRLIVYLVCLCSVMLLNGFVLLTCFHHNHFLLLSTHALMSRLQLSNLIGENPPGVLSEVAT